MSKFPVSCCFLPYDLNLWLDNQSQYLLGFEFLVIEYRTIRNQLVRTTSELKFQGLLFYRPRTSESNVFAGVVCLSRGGRVRDGYSDQVALPPSPQLGLVQGGEGVGVDTLT